MPRTVFTPRAFTCVSTEAIEWPSSGGHELVQVGPKEAYFFTYRDPTEAGEEIVVVQGFLPSWRHARYFGAAGIGLMLAEGLLLQSDGPVNAPDDLLWGYG